MSLQESFSPAPSRKIDRTTVRVTNNCSSDIRHTKRWAEHARVEWPDNTDAHWAAAAHVNVRLTQYWLEDEPKRFVNAAGISAVMVKMLKRD